MKPLTINEIFELYPTLKSETGWSKEDLQVFHESHLLPGDYLTENSTKIDDLSIEKESLDKLIEYWKNVQRNH